MATIDFRAAYELLRRVMEQQELERRGGGSEPNSASGFSSGGYGNPPGGLPGRLIESQEKQNPYGSNPALVGPTPSESRDPNFRELKRIPIVTQSQYPTTSSDTTGDQSSSSYSPGVDAAFNWSNAPSKGTGLGAPGLMPAPPWFVPSLASGPFRFPGTKLPFPLMGPGKAPQIPVPTVPEWTKALGTLIQMYPNSFLRGKSGGTFDNFRRCMRAATRNAQAWEDFCDDLGDEKGDCYSKTYESVVNKKGWCHRRFGIGWE